MTAVVAVPQQEYLTLRLPAKPSTEHKASEDGVQNSHGTLDCFETAGCLVQRQSPV